MKGTQVNIVIQCEYFLHMRDNAAKREILLKSSSKEFWLWMNDSLKVAFPENLTKL